VITKEQAFLMNRRGRKRFIDRQNLEKAIASDPPEGTVIENPTLWRVMKNIIVATVGSGPIRFQAGKLIEDPAVASELRAAGAVLRPIG